MSTLRRYKIPLGRHDDKHGFLEALRLLAREAAAGLQENF
jgi:hypothetical protein